MREGGRQVLIDRPVPTVEGAVTKQKLLNVSNSAFPIAENGQQHQQQTYNSNSDDRSRLQSSIPACYSNSKQEEPELQRGKQNLMFDFSDNHNILKYAVEVEHAADLQQIDHSNYVESVPNSLSSTNKCSSSSAIASCNLSAADVLGKIYIFIFAQSLENTIIY